MSHARRKFFDAKDNDVGRTGYVLQQMEFLYALEKKARDWSADDRLALRQHEAVHILDKLGAWMNGVSEIAAPRCYRKSDGLQYHSMEETMSLFHRRELMY